MKIQSKPKIGFLRLAIEAILIFGSVYGAFVLEDIRSKNFERQLLKEKLETHVDILAADSVTFNSRLTRGTTSFSTRLFESFDQHDEALSLLKKADPTSIREVYEMHKNGSLFVRIIQSATKSQHNLEDLRQEYEHLLLLDSTRYWLDKYEYHAWVINAFAGYVDAAFDELTDFGMKNYFVLTDNDKEAHIREFVTHPFYYNSITNHKSTFLVLVDLMEDYREDYPQIKKALQKEIEAQDEKL